MQPLRFDIAIAGNQLAARMAAALLAKHGKRVFLLSATPHRDPWQHASLFIEKLLDALGGRDCLAGHQPFQVLSSRARISIHRDRPLSDELLREFGSSAAQVKALLDDLERSGTFLEELLWLHGGLPAGGVREILAWRWLCLRNKLSLARLAIPLTERLRGMPEPAGEWLRDLFQGLSLHPLDTLSVADAALLWAHARRPGGFAGYELDELLRKRFEQFHGVEVPFETLQAVEHHHGQWVCNLAGGRRFQAGELLLGDLAHDLPGLPPLPRLPACSPPRRFTTSPFDGQLSALLEKRVIAGGSRPVRIAFVSTPKGLVGEVGSDATSDEGGVQQQLEPVLPFARYRLDPCEHLPGRATATAIDTVPSLFKLPLHLGSHLWCADAHRLVPHLGSGGAALLAWTLVRHLDQTIITRND